MRKALTQFIRGKCHTEEHSKAAGKEQLTGFYVPGNLKTKQTCKLNHSRMVEVDHAAVILDGQDVLQAEAAAALEELTDGVLCVRMQVYCMCEM